jgi:hypothetical protein
MDTFGYGLMIAIFGGLIVLLLMRQFWLWYTGVSRILELLESIDA